MIRCTVHQGVLCTIVVPSGVVVVLATNLVIVVVDLVGIASHFLVPILLQTVLRLGVLRYQTVQGQW